jgi:hypothetical protein
LEEGGAGLEILDIEAVLTLLQTSSRAQNGLRGKSEVKFFLPKKLESYKPEVIVQGCHFC